MHKITPDDWRNRLKWNAYREAVAEMLERTTTTYAPWTIVEAEDKLWREIKALETVIAALEKAGCVKHVEALGWVVVCALTIAASLANDAVRIQDPYAGGTGNGGAARCTSLHDRPLFVIPAQLVQGRALPRCGIMTSSA